jgi:hypothetical protein
MAATRFRGLVRGTALLGSMVATLVASRDARASDEGTGVEAALERPLDRSKIVQRPFAFVTDPSTPGGGHLALVMDLGMSSGRDADRPLPVTLASSSPNTSVGAQYGIVDRVAVYGSAIFHREGRASAAGGVTVRLTNAVAPLRATISAGALHEGLTGNSGASALAAVSLDHGPVRFAANVMAEKIFAENRDKVDYVVLAGGSVRVARQLRLGGEWVSQDVEETFSAGAEGGALHAVGPDAALELDGGRYQFTVATLFGVTAASPRALFRAGLSYNY